MFEHMALQADNHVEFFVVLFLVVAIWIKIAMSEGRKEKEAAKSKAIKIAEDERKKQESTNAAVELVKSSYQSLPDVGSAIGLLKSRYKWLDIVATIKIYPNEIRLLEEIYLSESGKITLPNLKSKKPNLDERRVIEKIRETTSKIHGVEAYGEEFHTQQLSNEMKDDLFMYYGDEDYSDEPTAKNMFSLVEMDFVRLNKPASETDRTFFCTLTKKGKAFVDLNYSFSDKNSSFYETKDSPSYNLGIEISKVIYRSIDISSEKA